MRYLYEVKINGKTIGITEGNEDNGRFEGGILYGPGGVIVQASPTESPVIRQQYPNDTDEGYTFGQLHGRQPQIVGPELVSNEEFSRRVEVVESAR